jgi:hypothetical protein
MYLQAQQQSLGQQEQHLLPQVAVQHMLYLSDHAPVVVCMHIAAVSHQSLYIAMSTLRAYSRWHGKPASQHYVACLASLKE